MKDAHKKVVLFQPNKVIRNTNNNKHFWPLQQQIYNKLYSEFM